MTSKKTKHWHHNTSTATLPISSTIRHACKPTDFFVKSFRFGIFRKTRYFWHFFWLNINLHTEQNTLSHPNSSSQNSLSNAIKMQQDVVVLQRLYVSSGITRFLINIPPWHWASLEIIKDMLNPMHSIFQNVCKPLFFIKMVIANSDLLIIL